MVRDVTTEEEANPLKASSLSMIAHELRAPLNTINGFLDLALAGVGGDLNEQQREFVQRARVSSEQLYALLENLLLVTRADARQFRLNQGIVNLSQVIRQAVDELELTASDSEVRIDIAVPDTVFYIYADVVRLQQVLRNLLGNALRCTDRGGQITISAWTESVEPAVPSSEEPSQVAFLRIQDDGIGIPGEYHQRIFERFFQVPVSHQGRPGSQGLGLAIVKLIVEGHGGSVTVVSSPGEGSIFTCRLPCVLS
jgi:signal transduction histidine kinase